MKFFLAAMARDIRLHLRSPQDILNPLVFFLVVISLFPLGVSPSPGQLSAIAPGVIWVAALLATLMSMDLMFRSDFEDGSLEQMVGSGQSMIVLSLAKVLAHWLVSGLPLILLMPVVGLLLFLPFDVIVTMAVSLALVSPTLSLLGGIGAALTVGLERGGLLVTILVLPLYVPVLVLATAMAGASMTGLPIQGYIYWLAAILLLAISLAPLAIAAGLRISVER